MRPRRPNHGSSPVPLKKNQYTTRAPKTPNKQTKKLAGKQTRTHNQVSEIV